MEELSIRPWIILAGLLASSGGGDIRLIKSTCDISTAIMNVTGAIGILMHLMFMPMSDTSPGLFGQLVEIMLKGCWNKISFHSHLEPVRTNGNGLRCLSQTYLVRCRRPSRASLVFRNGLRCRSTAIYI